MDIVEWLRKEAELVALDRLNEAAAEIERLRAALRSFRSLVKEGGVPRYTVLPGAALNSLIEEVVDPLMRGHG